MIRMRSMIILTLACTAMLVVDCPADPTTLPATAPSKELVTSMEQLAADEPTDRQAAQDRLVQFGSEAVDPLQKLIATTGDVEQRTGAQAALARIAEQASIGPTLITMKMQNATPAQLIAELSRQAGVPIKHFNNGGGFGNDPAVNGGLSVDLDHQPFWAAVKEICRITGLQITSRGNGNILGIGQGGNDLAGPCVIDGPFMIIAQTISSNSSIQLSQPANINRNTNIQFTFYSEPKLKISQHPYNVRLTEATDDTGRSLQLQGQSQYESYSTTNQVYWQGTSQLAVPEAGAKKIAHLRGQMKLFAAIKTETIEIPDILTAHNVSKTVGGQTLIVKDVTPGDNEVTVNLTIMIPPDRGNAAYSMQQNIRLLDAQGNALQLRSSSGSSNATKLDYKMSFSKQTYDEEEKLVGDPVKLVLPIVVETRPVECNFEFKDLPLP